MCSKSRWRLSRCLLFSLLLASLLAGPGLAQSPTPLANLDIALWPEYDRPEVLVIFRGRIADAATLPAQLSFTLPATVQALHAVAYLDEARGSLVDIPDYAFSPSGDGKVLSFRTPGRQFQFEYYHTDVLNISGDVRTLSFSFAPSADIANLTLEVQQPTTAQAFTSNPPPSTTQVGQNGLTYALYQIGAVSAGDSRSLQASYTRNTDQLSAAEGVSLPSTIEQTPV